MASARAPGLSEALLEGIALLLQGGAVLLHELAHRHVVRLLLAGDLGALPEASSVEKASLACETLRVVAAETGAVSRGVVAATRGANIAGR